MSTQKNQGRPQRQPEKNPPRPAGPEVVYTQPKPFRSRRLVLQLLTLFAVVLAVFMGISVFFKVERVEVIGFNKYSADIVWDASDIHLGDSLLFFGRAGAATRIQDALPYVSSVHFGIKLPGTVIISIEEVPVVYAIKDRSDSWWLMTSEGKITEHTDSAVANNSTRITGVVLDSPQVGAQAVAYEEPATPGSTEPVTVTGADRLNAALAVVQQLELNRLLSKITTLDVQDPFALEMWYETRFQVELGSTQRLDYKIVALISAVEQLGSQRTGVLDVSFETNAEEIIHRPFEE